MARFDRQIAMAHRLIKKNGQTAIWRQLMRPNNPGPPDDTDVSIPVDHSPFICFLPITKEDRQFINFLRDTNEVKTGNVLGYMGQVPFTPSAEDIVIRDGVTMAISNIDLISPNGQKILYIIEFKI